MEAAAAPFDEHRARPLDVFEGRNGGQEVARICQAIGADRAAIGQRERPAVVLTDIGARRTVQRLGAELHAARENADFAGLDVDHPELREEAQPSLLRDDQQFAVRIEEEFVLHGRGDEGEMRGHAGLGVRVARCGDRAKAGDEGELVLRDLDRPPAQLADRQAALVARGRRGAQKTLSTFW